MYENTIDIHMKSPTCVQKRGNRTQGCEQYVSGNAIDFRFHYETKSAFLAAFLAAFLSSFLPFWVPSGVASWLPFWLLFWLSFWRPFWSPLTLREPFLRGLVKTLLGEDQIDNCTRVVLAAASIFKIVG